MKIHRNVEFSRIHNASGHKLEQQQCLPGLNLISYKLSCPGFCTSGVSGVDSAEDRTVGWGYKPLGVIPVPSMLNSPRTGLELLMGKQELDFSICLEQSP